MDCHLCHSAYRDSGKSPLIIAIQTSSYVLYISSELTRAQSQIGCITSVNIKYCDNNKENKNFSLAVIYFVSVSSLYSVSIIVESYSFPSSQFIAFLHTPRN